MHRASRTALLVAAYRARASVPPPDGPGLCHDPWAAALAGPEGLALAARFDPIFPEGDLWLGLRTAHLDAEVLRLTAGAEGRSQVVILGAGLDTRAARLGHAAGGTPDGRHFFEVDHPATQAEKRARLAGLDGYPGDAATTYVGCDFESEDFLERLVASGFRPDQPAVVLWEGVSYYLTEAAVRTTLGRIATSCHPRTVLLFDYVQRKLVEGRTRDADDLATRDLVAELGEPFRFGINDLLPLVYEQGFRYLRTISFDEICLERTGTYLRSRKFRFQLIATTSRTAP
jgi:methyltransferase (TIGR00027 family)